MIQTYKNKIVSPQTTSLWSGDLVTLLPECKTPRINWHGKKVPLALLYEALAFFRHAEDTWNSEAMLRLAYNRETETWKLICLPQYIGTGMTVSEIKNRNEEQERLAQAAYPPGYIDNGSIHSHCNSEAFQSGTDLANELENPGLHITLGKVKSSNIDCHGRVSFRGVMYPIVWNQFLENLGDEELVDCNLTLAEPRKTTTFPKEWLDVCYKKPKPTTFGSSMFDNKLPIWKRKSKVNGFSKYFGKYSDWDHLDDGTIGYETNELSKDKTTRRQDDIIFAAACALETEPAAIDLCQTILRTFLNFNILTEEELKESTNYYEAKENEAADDNAALALQDVQEVVDIMKKIEDLPPDFAEVIYETMLERSAF